MRIAQSLIHLATMLAAAFVISACNHETTTETKETKTTSGGTERTTQQTKTTRTTHATRTTAPPAKAGGQVEPATETSAPAPATETPADANQATTGVASAPVATPVRDTSRAGIEVTSATSELRHQLDVESSSTAQYMDRTSSVSIYVNQLQFKLNQASEHATDAQKVVISQYYRKIYDPVELAGKGADDQAFGDMVRDLRKIMDEFDRDFAGAK